MTWMPTIASCDSYLGMRTGAYEHRAIRYRAAADWMTASGLTHDMTIVDVGAGMTELDYCLRAEYGWRGRYIPVDGGIDGVNLNDWTPPREAHFFVALEIIEHLFNWRRLIEALRQKTLNGLVISTPNPRTTDVLAMDTTHTVEVFAADLQAYGFHVSEETFYGGVLSGGEPDALFATWSDRCAPRVPTRWTGTSPV
jgi:hypothetical protein